MQLDFIHAAKAVALSLTLSLIGAGTLGDILTPTPAYAQVSAPLNYTFDYPGTLHESSTMTESASPYFWLDSGGKLLIANGIGSTIQGTLPASDRWSALYATLLPTISDGGTHPQNAFRLFTKQSLQNVSASVYLNRKASNLSNAANRHAYNGESIFARYKDTKNFYYAGIREDGSAVIKKQVNGQYQTLTSKKVFPGTYNTLSNYNLIPLSKWIGLKLIVTDTPTGPKLDFYTDIGKTGAWTLALSVVDDPKKFGAAVTGAGFVAIETDFSDVEIDDFSVSEATSVTSTTPTPTPKAAYDTTVLSHAPVLYLAMNGTGTETDKTGNGHTGTYKGSPTSSTMPNGDKAVVFDGASQYLTVPSSKALSITTTKKLTWEAWIRPDTLQFPRASEDGYVDWMGKCDQYSPTCEWEARMYNASSQANRPSRMSAYVFNSSAGLGSGADWQPATSIISAGKWLHVVAQYDLTTTPSGCSSSYPGQINIWVNGVKWNMGKHMPTGCMSQYSIKPTANNSALNIGTMAMDTWFKGAIGKVAVYDRLLSQAEISEHYSAMTGKTPSGSCADTCTSAY